MHVEKRAATPVPTPPVEYVITLTAEEQSKVYSMLYGVKYTIDRQTPFAFYESEKELATALMDAFALANEGS